MTKAPEILNTINISDLQDIFTLTFRIQGGYSSYDDVQINRNVTALIILIA